MNDDTLLQYLLQMGAMNQDEAQVKRKQARIDALRELPSTSGQLVNAGRYKVAASPLAAFADAVRTGLGAYQQAGLDDEVAGLGRRRAELLRGMGRRTSPPGDLPADPFFNGTGGSPY